MFKDHIAKIQTYIDGQESVLTVEDFKAWRQGFRLAVAHEEQIVIQENQIAIQKEQIATLQANLDAANAQLTPLISRQWHEEYLIEVNRSRISEVNTLLEALHWIADAEPALTPDAVVLQRDLFQAIAVDAIDTHPEEWAEWPKSVLEALGKTVEEMPPPIPLEVGPMLGQFQDIANTILKIETTPQWELEE